MTLFQFRWLRRFIRRRTKPIPVDVAAVWKKRLMIAYAIFAWNAFGLVVYEILHGKKILSEYYGVTKGTSTPGREWAETLNIHGDIKVIQVTGVTKTGEYEFSREEKYVGLLKDYYEKKAQKTENKSEVVDKEEMAE